jgi:hypothetical protein
MYPVRIFIKLPSAFIHYLFAYDSEELKLNRFFISFVLRCFTIYGSTE